MALMRTAGYSPAILLPIRTGAMTDTSATAPDGAPDAPQLYLVSPPVFDPGAFPDILAACLDAVETACVRLALASRDEDDISRAADALRTVCHPRDVALVIESHVRLATPLGLDGVHLLDGARSVKAARKTLGEDAIVGAFCAASRHDGITAGELGADYASFGPLGQTALGTAEPVPHDLFHWWSDMIEVPCVAEGALTEELIRALAPHTDFFAIGDEIWGADRPADVLRALWAATA